MSSSYNKWDLIYRKNPLNTLGWELGRPRPILVQLIQKGLISKGKALDLCCGAGTNSIYLAKKGFQVTATDISSLALQYACEKIKKENLMIDLIRSSFVNLSFCSEIFDLIFDMGCFHHVEIDDRISFIEGVSQVIKNNGYYLLTCFSEKNGLSWNHFTKNQLIELFSPFFKILKIMHYSSLEGDNVIRYFYTILMKK